MKGLLLKDWYMTRKYCKIYLVVSVLFVGTSVALKPSLFFMFYPCMLCALLPFTLLSYDEHSRWQRYSETLPYTRAQIVSGKYLMGLFAQLAILFVSGIAQAIRMGFQNSFVLSEHLSLMMILMAMSLISSSITPPFMFKLGVEKGRMAYYVTIGVVCAGAVILANLSDKIKPVATNMNVVLPIICLISIGVFALSWYLSIVFYRKREF